MKVLPFKNAVDRFNNMIDICLMDVQGLELEILRDAPDNKLKNITHFLVGTHGTDIHNELLQLFKNLKYDIVLNDLRGKITDQPDGLIYAKKQNKD